MFAPVSRALPRAVLLLAASLGTAATASAQSASYRGPTVSAVWDVPTSRPSTVCGGWGTVRADTIGFDCARIENGARVTGAAAAFSRDGRLGAVASTSVQDLTVGYQFNSYVSASAGYDGRVTVSAPSDVHVEYVRFGIRLHGELLADATLRGSRDGQCFWLGDATAAAGIRFSTAVGSVWPVTGTGDVSATPLDRTTGCGSRASTADFSDMLYFQMPLSDGGAFHYELFANASFRASSLTDDLDRPYSANLSADFIHTAGIESVMALDANGNEVSGASITFDDPSLVIGPLYPQTAVPEPATLALVATGLATLGGLTVRRRRRPA